MRTILRRWLFVVATIASSLATTQTHAQCPHGAICNPASAHSVDVCWISNGMGGGSTISRGAGTIDVAAVLRQGCVEFAAAESRPGATVVWDSCNPVLPAPNLDFFGGQWGIYNVSGSLRVVDSHGNTISSGSGEWGLATCACSDSRNINVVGLGNDGQCYCRGGQFWDDTIRACVTTPPAPLRIDLYGASSTRHSLPVPSSRKWRV